MNRLVKAALFVCLGAGGAADVVAQDPLRIELSVGSCRYGLAEDGAWRKEHYYGAFEYLVFCGHLAASRTPWRLFGAPLGWRLAWVDLGRPRAETLAPVRDDESNSFPSGQNCISVFGSRRGCVGLFQMDGGAYGVSLGPLVERKHGEITVGMEGGLYHYYSWWHVSMTIPAPGTCSSCTQTFSDTWNLANGRHTTSYMGVSASYGNWYAQLRRYTAIYASQADKNHQFVGAIGGPLVNVTAGYRWIW